MLVTTNAIVLSSIKYGEADLIIKCFTENYGVKSYLLKGILKTKKGALKPALFQLFSILEITASHRQNSELHFIKETKIAVPLQEIQNNIVKLSLVLFLSEVVRQSIREEEENSSLYRFLEQTVLWLENNNSVADFHLVFMVQLTHFLGFFPDISTIEKPVFNPVEGIFEDVATNNYAIVLESKSAFKKLLITDFETLSVLEISKKQREQYLQMLLLYYQLHIQGFKTPKSLSVLTSIFH